MRRFNRILVDSINESQLDVSTAINIVEDIIAIEQINLDTNILLKDEIASLRTEYRISHAEILLSLLRRHMDLPGGPQL